MPTWVTLPKDQCPNKWFDLPYDDPVVRLDRALYGHPLAGLYWEQHARSALLKCGFLQVPSVQCLYVHPQKCLFLSVYVDDSRLCGLKCNTQQAWVDIRELLVLDDPTSIEDNVYLGVRQKNVPTQDWMVAEKSNLFDVIRKGYTTS